MARFRPEDEALADRIVLHDLLPRLDDRVVGPDVERVLVGEKHGERVGEFANQPPLREIVPEPERRHIAFVVPDDVALRVEARQERLYLLGVPRDVEIPSREQHLRVGVVRVRLREELVEREDLHREVLLPVLVAHPLAKADRVEELRSGGALSVGIDRRLRHLPVLIDPLVVADVPDLGIGHMVARPLVRERDELRFLLREEVLGRARVPVRHRAEVFGDHQSTFKRVLLEVVAQLTPVLETPEERAVVVRGADAGERFRRIGIGAGFWERTLKEVVLPDTEHERVETTLKNPVDLLLPVFGAPMLGLETREAAVREVTDGAVLEVRLLVNVEIREIDRILLRHHVAVPKPVAAAAPFKEVVEPVPHAARIRAGDGDCGN